MARRPRKTFDQYLRESLERDPELASVYEETRIEGQLALSLARVREERRMTQRQLAAASGIAQPVISRLERGAETPMIATLQKLARALDAKVEIGADGAKFHIAAPASPEMHPSLNALVSNTIADFAAARFGAFSFTDILASGVQSFKDSTILPENIARHIQLPPQAAVGWPGGSVSGVSGLASSLLQQEWFELADNSVGDVISRLTMSGVAAPALTEPTSTPRQSLALAS